MPIASRKRRRRRSRPFRGFETLEARRVLATFVVDITADTLGGTCDDSPIGDCSLRDAIAAAESNPGPDRIEIPAGRYTIDSVLDGFVLTAADDTEFVGTGLVPQDVLIDGDFQVRVFDLLGGAGVSKISFENLTIENGIANDGSGGGGINASTSVDLSLDNVVVQNNVADLNFASFPTSGGGIVASGNVEITNSVIRDNFATGDAGGIDYIRNFAEPQLKTLVIRNTSILGNTSSDIGGGIRLRSGTNVLIDSVIVQDNEGPTSGGGIYSEGANLTVMNSTFTSNTAPAAESGGGGLYILGNASSDPFSVINTDFDNNEAVDGAGGLEVVNSAGTIIGGVFTQNRVTGTGDTFDQGGGAIVVIGSADPTFDGLPVRIDGVTVRDNTAPAAGGIALVNATVTIVDSLIENNTATSFLAGGGGIGGINDNGESFLTLQRSRVIGNVTNADAGGVGLIDVDLNIFETTISGNTAAARAGGLGVLANSDVPLLVIDSSTINGNTAANVGGGLGIIGADVRMTNTTVTQNESQLTGGGIAYDNSNAGVSSTISFSTIAENTAPGVGTNLLTQGTEPLAVSNTILALGDCAGPIQSGGFNIDEGLSCGLNDPSDLNDTDPLLGPLADNGGFVFTRSLNAGSPAIDAAGEDIATDARGFFRPVDGDGNLTATSDIGAFEAAATASTELVELLLQATDDQDNLLTPDAQGDFNVSINEVFFLELGYQDLRTPPDQLGVAKYAADLQTSTNGVLVPAVTATQFFTFEDTLLGENAGTITFTNSDPGGQSADVNVVDFLNDPAATTTAALVQIGFPDGKFSVSNLRSTGDGGNLIQSVRFDDNDFILVNQPRIDVAVTNTSVAVDATTNLINPLLPNGNINPDAVPFILDTNSRTTGTNYFGTPATGSFTEDGGYRNLGGVGSGGPPGDASTAFDALSIPVLFTEPVQDLVITAVPSLNATNGGQGSGPTGPQNLNNRLDVNGDLKVTSLDAIIVISQLARGLGTTSRTDVDNSGTTSPLDALIIINELSQRQLEGTEDATTFVSDDGDFILWHQEFALAPELVLSDQDAQLTFNALASLVVDENSDIDDGVVTPGNLSLREAIRIANDTDGPATITFGGIFVDATPDTLVLADTEFSVTDDLELIGPGSNLLTIDANDASRHFNFSTVNSQVSISGLTLTGGRAENGNGGSIVNNGAAVTIADSVITGNLATNQFSEGYGGAIQNSGYMTITSSTITGNSAQNDGGGIVNFGELFIQQSILASNTADSFGGAIANFSSALNIANSTIANNDAGNDGGGIYNAGGELTLADSNVTGNTATEGGGGLYSDGDATITGSAIIGNTAGEDGGALLLVDSTSDIANTTISGNSADRSGGAVFASGSAQTSIIQSSVIANRADADGDATGAGGINNDIASTAVTRLYNSIVAGNVSGAPGLDTPSDVVGIALEAASSHNLIGDPATAGGLTEGSGGNLVGNGAGGLLDLSLIVEPLADNGGNTQTHALAAGSRAIDSGANNFATSGGDDLIPGTGDDGEEILFDDQRGDGFPRILNGAVDIGAFESEPLPITSKPDLEASSDTGFSDSDNITFVTTPRLTGFADAGATIEIFDRRLPVRRLTYDENTDFFPTWDPASETIAYVTELGVSNPANSVSNIGLVQSDATGERVGLDSVPEGFFGVGHSPSWVGSTGLVMINERVGAHTYATFDSNAAPTTAFNSLLTIASGGDNIVVSRDGSTALWRVSTSGGSGTVTIRTAPFASLAGQPAETHGVPLQSISSPVPQQYFTDSHGFALSPDGSQYVIAEPQNISGNSFSGFDLFLRSTVDGSVIQRLTTSGQDFGAFNGQPAFSPDGTQVAFVRALGVLGVDDIYAIKTDGTGLTNLTDTGPRVTERMPSYANDGDRLAFATPATEEAISPLFNETNNWNIYVIEGLAATQPPGALIGTTVADASGNWSLGVGVLAEGDHVLAARATLAGLVGPVSDTLRVTIDTTSPEFPSVPDLSDGSDTGQSNDDDVTQDLTPTFEGSAIAGSTVELFADGISIGEVTAATALYDADDLIVVDPTAFGEGAVFAVDPLTGTQTVVSSGQNFDSPNALAFDSDGNLYVTDSGAQAVFTVDPFTGFQTLLTSGGLLQNPTDIVVDGSGNLLVTDSGAAAVIQIDPATGNQTSFASGQNFTVNGLRGIALDAQGNLLVTDADADLLIRIDPVSKAQSVLSSGGDFVDPGSVLVAPTGQIYVTDSSAFSGSGGVLLIDPFTGEQTTLTSGGSFLDPVDVLVDDVQDLIVIDASARTLFRADPLSQNVLSTAGNFGSPSGVAAAVLPQGEYVLTSGELAPSDYLISALATDVAGNVSGRTTVKHLEFNQDSVLPSFEPDIAHFNDTGLLESNLFMTMDGFLQQQTFSNDGVASYRFPNVNRTSGGLDPSLGIVQEARLQVSGIEGTGGVTLSTSDGVNEYTARLTPTGVSVATSSGSQFVAVDVAQPHTYRIESPGNSDTVSLFVDDALVLIAAAPALASNGFEFGDTAAASGNGADAAYEYVRVAQQAVGSSLAVTLEEPRLLIQDVVVDEAAGVAEVAVTLTAEVASPFTVEFTTLDDDAIDGDNSNPGENDYGTTSDTLSFDGFSGEVQLITVPIEDDSVVEDIEQFTIELFNLLPDTLTIDTSDIGTVNIIDDDSATVTVFSQSVSESESEIEVTLTFNGQTQDSVDVLVDTIDGFGAESDVDFTSTFESVTFDGFDGELRTVTIPILGDDIVELDEELLISVQFESPDRRNITFDEFADLIVFDPDGGFTEAGFRPNDIELFTPDNSTTIAYVGDQDGLRVLDFTDTQFPVELGSFPLAGGIEEISVVASGQFDGLLYVAAGDNGLVVLDVSEPSNISQVGAFAVADQQAISVVKVGETVFLGEKHNVNLTDGGMRILDVSDPANITQLGLFSGFASVDDIAVQGTTAYLAIQGTPGNLQIVDVADPTSPSFLGTFANREATAIAIDGTSAFLGTPDGVAKLDVSDPANVIERAFFSTQSVITKINNIGSILSVGDAEGSFGFLDGSQFNFFRSLGNTSVDSDPITGIANDGFNYFLASGTVGISVIDTILLDDEFTSILNDDSATLSINDVSELEDNGSLTFTVTLSGDVDTSFTVDVETLDLPGEAVAGDDYVAESDSLSFSGFDTETQTFTVTLLADTDVEPDETFAADILDVSADGRDVSADSPGRGIGTILNDDLAAGADLQITKSDDVDPVIPGDSLTYTLIVTNNGPDVATNVVVTDLLPSEVSFQIGDVDGDESAVTNNGNDVTASVGTLGVNQSSTITIFVSVSDSAEGDLVNSASVSGTEADGVPTNNTATETTTVTVFLNDDEETIDEDFDTISLDVLSNDLPLGALTITDVSSASLGTAMIVGGTEISYLPDPDAFGQDIFSYTATNGFGETSSALITITIQPINDPPETTDDPVDANDQASPLTIDVADLLSNDSPGPNEESTQTLSLTDLDGTSANGGTVSLLGNTITYTPPAGFTGLTDSFQYEVSDDASPPLSAMGTVTISFPPPPATLQGHVYCDEDGDGVEGLGEAVIGTLVFLDENGNRQLDAGERSTFTDGNGDYSFDNITDPMLTVVAEVPSGCLSVPANPGIARAQFGIEDLAHSLTATDFDRDGDVDLVVVGDLVNDQATFLENNDGVFSIHGTTALGNRPRSIASWESGAVQVSAVAGVGTPEDLGTVFLMSGSNVIDTHQTGDGPVDVAIADFDGNNQPDVVVAALRSSDVHLILNGVVQPDPIGDTRLARAVEAGDVNGDGNDDIVIGGYSYPDDEFSQLAILLGDGLGGFAEPLLADPSREVVDLGIAPLVENSDENVVWALSAEGSLSVYGIVDGLLELISTTDVTSGATAFDVGDFNRDGRTDLAVASLGNQMVELYIGNGDGQFILITSLSEVSAPSDLVVADFDQDGADDVAVTNLYQDLNLGSAGSPDFKLPSQVTVLLVDVAENAVVISAGTVGQVDFEFQNADPEIRFDVSGDGRVTALDALRVINRLQEMQPEGEQVNVREATDVNGDGYTSALDALLVINELSRRNESDVAIDLLTDDEDEEERIAAVDVIFGQLV